LIGGHAQTIHAALRILPACRTRTGRIELDDGDFLDLDWHDGDSDGDKLAIICHGLEGSSNANYVRGMAIALSKRGWNALAWNYRGCGNEPNRLLTSYHIGKTDDLDHVIRHVIATRQPRRIDLIGFSLGGNLMLKYLGERGDAVHSAIHRGVAFSAPCELACSSNELSKWQNRIYMARFLKSLRRKMKDKHRKFPDSLNVTGLSRIRNFAEFDGRFTAPIHGFQGASDYWIRSSSRQFLESIRVPTLLVNAANDPFLGPNCYPFDEARRNPAFHLEVPDQGGHVGFGCGVEYWSEKRAVEFLSMP